MLICLKCLTEKPFEWSLDPQNGCRQQLKLTISKVCRPFRGNISNILKKPFEWSLDLQSGSKLKYNIILGLKYYLKLYKRNQKQPFQRSEDHFWKVLRRFFECLSIILLPSYNYLQTYEVSSKQV